MNGQHESRVFEQLVLDHLDMLYAVGVKLTGNAEDAQLLVQATICNAFRFRDSLEKEAYFKSWLLSMLRTTFLTNSHRAPRKKAANL